MIRKTPKLCRGEIPRTAKQAVNVDDEGTIDDLMLAINKKLELS